MAGDKDRDVHPTALLARQRSLKRGTSSFAFKDRISLRIQGNKRGPCPKPELVTCSGLEDFGLWICCFNVPMQLNCRPPNSLGSPEMRFPPLLTVLLLLLLLLMLDTD